MFDGLAEPAQLVELLSVFGVCLLLQLHGVRPGALSLKQGDVQVPGGTTQGDVQVLGGTLR